MDSRAVPRQSTLEGLEPVWLDTDVSGLILDCSEAALLLLDYSFRGIRGRSLPIMFIENRPHGAELAAVFRGVPVQRSGVIRPRDRRGVAVRFVVQVAPEVDDTRALRWSFTDMQSGRRSETAKSPRAPTGDAGGM